MTKPFIKLYQSQKNKKELDATLSMIIVKPILTRRNGKIRSRKEVMEAAERKPVPGEGNPYPFCVIGKFEVVHRNRQTSPTEMIPMGPASKQHLRPITIWHCPECGTSVERRPIPAADNSGL